MRGDVFIKDKIKNVFIIFLILILLIIVYSKFISKDDIVKIFGKSFLIVVTGSMEPTIKAGELIVISDETGYKTGDIVTFKDQEGYIITHRIVSMDNEKIVTKGDGNNIQDEENSINNIKGKVIFHSKILGVFVIYLLKPLIIIYLMAIGVVFLYKSNKNGFK